MTQFSLKCWLVFLHAVFRVHAAVYLPNVECQPVPTTVALDYPQHRFDPYYVTLHRCQGSVQQTNPNIKKCVATVYKELEVFAYSKEKGQFEVLTMKNHTTCGSECQADPTDCHYPVQTWNRDKCKCDCLYPNSAPPEHVTPRKKGFRWNQHSCRYECGGSSTACPAEKEWDRKTCSCVCSTFYKRKCGHDGFLDSNTCECKEQAVHGRRPGFFSCVSALVLFVLLIVAVAVIILLSCLLYKATRKRQSMKQATSQASQMTGSSNDTAGTILEARDTAVAVSGSEETSGSTLFVSGV